MRNQASFIMDHPIAKSYFQFQLSTWVLDKNLDRVLEQWKAQFAQPYLQRDGHMNFQPTAVETKSQVDNKADKFRTS